MRVLIRYLGDSKYSKSLIKPSCVKIRKLGEVLKYKALSKPLKELKGNRKSFRIWLENELIINILYLIEKENLTTYLHKDIIPTICMYALKNSSIVTEILKDIKTNKLLQLTIKENSKF